MKILLLIDSLGPGGAQRQLTQLAVGLRQKGHEVYFLTYHQINFFKYELDKAGIGVNTIIENNYFIRFLKIRKAIRAFQPNAVISFLEAANLMATCAGFPYRKWKLIVGERSANPKIVIKFRLRFFRLFHFFTDFVVANSQKNLDLLKKINPFLPSRKLKVIYNGLDLYDFNSTTSFNSGITNIVVAASYRPVKNLHGLIDAVKNLPKEYQQKIRINWFGNTYTGYDYFQKCQDKIYSLGLDEIIMLNDQTEVIKHRYAEADFIGLFSYFEGFPNAICEAMAMGKPVIVTDVSDVPLLVKEGENGFLCQAARVNSIAAAIIKATNTSNDKKKIMGGANRRLAEFYFSREKMVDQYLNLIDSQ